MTRINFIYMKLELVNHEITHSKVERYSYEHERSFLKGGVDMKRFIRSKKLIFIHEDGSISNFFFDLSLESIKSFMIDKNTKYRSYNISNYLYSNYKTINRLSDIYNNKTIQLVYQVAENIRNEINNIRCIVNSDTHGDLLMFLLPYVVSNSILNISINNDSISYHTFNSGIIHINNGDYFIDKNLIRNNRSLSEEVHSQFGQPANIIIQTFLFAFLTDSLSYRFYAYFMMGNHDKHFFSSKPIIQISYITKMNNLYTFNNEVYKQNKIAESKHLDLNIPDIDLMTTPDNYQYVDNNSLIDNICSRIFIRISEEYYLFQHGLYKSKRDVIENSIVSLSISARDLISTDIDVFVYKFNDKDIRYEDLYETEINPYKDKNESTFNVKEEEDKLLKEIIDFNDAVSTRFNDISINYIPIIILGHNRHYEFLKYYNIPQLNYKDNNFDFKGLDNVGQPQKLEVLYAKEILNDLKSESKIFTKTYSIDMLYNSSLVEFEKNINIAKKITEDYPFRIKGGNDNFRILILFIIFIVLIIICLCYMNGCRGIKRRVISSHQLK